MTMKLSLLIIAGSVVIFSSAGTARDLSLAAAIKLAKENSHEIKAAGSRAEAFDEALSSAHAGRWPALSIDALANYKNEVAQFTIEPLPGVSFSREFGSKETYQSTARISLPLFTGGKITSSIALALARLKYYAAATEVTLDRIALAARIAYLSSLGADWNIKAAQASHKRAQSIQNDVTALYQAGAADSLDLLDAHQAVTRATLNVATADMVSRESLIKLRSLLGSNSDDKFTLVERLTEPAGKLDFNSENFDYRPELKMSLAAVEITKAGIARSRAAFYPDISLFGGYTYGKPNLDPFGNSWNDNFTVGAVLNWSFNLGRRKQHELNRARFLSKQAAYDSNQRRRILKDEADLSIERVKLAYDRFENASVNFRIASDRYRLAKTRHEQGDLSPNRMVEIEAELSLAEATRVTVLANYHIALSIYYHVTASKKLQEGI